jgi:Kef-type K+ transport system membrane component KefB
MNARGLMELVFISIGLEKGLISRDLYSILVAMTIVTTLAASPLFRIFQSDAMRSISLPYASRRSSAE